MRRIIVLTLTLAASLGGIFLTGASASAMPTVPPIRSSVAPASDAAPKVLTSVVVQTPTAQSYTVESGDTLWAIGIRFLHRSDAWSAIAAFNRIPNPDLIMVGEVVNLPPSTYVGSVVLPAAPPATPPVHHYTAPTRSYTPPAAPVVSRSYGAPGSFQACVAFRESTNGAGSSNIYGILNSTWSSLGLPGSAYTASRAQQDAAFQELYARDGTAPWAPYDGC